MSKEQPKSIEELCNYIDEHKDKIYVREQIDNEWRSLSLTELSSDRAIHHALRFVAMGLIPVYIKD
jgi:hypothetical protein